MAATRMCFVLMTLAAVAPVHAQSGNQAGRAGEAGWPPLPWPDYECDVEFPDAEKLSPMARQQLGITMQTASAVRDLLGKGRENFWKQYEQGGYEGALRSIRERAAVHSIYCGPEDRAYRSGVCLNYGLMCATHGGRQCATCLRAWAAHECAEGFRDAGAWKDLLEAAGKLEIPGFVQFLEKGKQKHVDPRTRAACLQAF